MFLHSWNEAVAAGPQAVGPKGWNLGRLSRYGFSVPIGGVLSADGYRLFMAHSELSSLVQTCSRQPEPAPPSLDRLRQAIITTPLPVPVTDELRHFLSTTGLEHIPVAVRSSAVDEDSSGASFAGIHQSFLNVTGFDAVSQAVRNCYASLWTVHALTYRHRLGIGEQQFATGVVILAMVPARTAGVSFSCDPRTGRLDRYAISATLGLGETVVSGTVAPDEYLVDVTAYPPVIARQQIGHKAQIAVPAADGGIRVRAADPAEADHPALDENQIAELAILTRRVFDSLGAMEQPQDLEWAHDGDGFWLLQARPVTHLPPPAFPAAASQQVIWSNANLKDVMPGVQSALGWSFLQSGIDTLMTAPLLAGGYPYTGGMLWVRLVAGRAYFNLSAMQWAFYDATGMKPAEFNRMLGGHQPEITVPAAGGLQTRLRRSLTRMRMALGAMAALLHARSHFDALWHWAQRIEQTPLVNWEKERFLTSMLDLRGKMDRLLGEFNLINGASGGTYQELVRLLEPVFGERAHAQVNGMLVGTTGITSAEQGDRLIRLGNQALTETKARAYFTAPQFEPAAWERRLEGTRFKEAFRAYLAEFGHRGVYELEPMNPRWREDPTYLLEVVRAHVESGQPMEHQGRREKRARARREVFGRLGWGLRHLKLRSLLWLSERSNVLREYCKSVLVRAVGVARLQALEVGRCMVAEGMLIAPEEIFHLTWLDMELYLMGRPGGGGLQLLAQDRQALRSRHLQHDPPDVLVGAVPAAPALPPKATGPVLRGLGAASGQAAGPARVIRHPGEGSRLRPGDVLVAPSTDPAWTPLFLRACAVVMEVGGYLSHGAIVAREYGLPAVINIPGLLQTIEDGEQLVVDGDSGQVHRLSKGAGS